MAGSDAKLSFAAALAIILVALLVGDAALGWLVTPLVLMLLLYAMARSPIRDSLLVMMFCGLALENPNEIPASGAWQSPFFSLGAILLIRLNKATGVEGLAFSGMDVLIVVLGLLYWSRRSSGSSIDKLGNVPTPLPMIRLAQLSLAGIAFCWVRGVAVGGGDSAAAIWQIDRVIYLPLLFLLFQMGLKGPKDHIAVGKVVLAAATVRALQAGYVQHYADRPVDPRTGEVPELAYSTTHHDSMLFAGAVVILAALLIQRVGRSSLRWTAILMPILVWGMLANGRRLVWVQIIAVLCVVYFVTAMNPVKRKLQRTLLYLSPLGLLYIQLGWNRSVGIFKPVSIIRSAVDSDVNASTAWRDIENFNLLWTIRQNPIFGTGYGHGFIEMIPLPPVDHMLERWVPHNSVLGMWAYCGLIGYTALTLLWGASVFFSIRGYHAATSPVDRAAGLASFAAVPIYFLQCYGDMGLGSWTGLYLMAPAMAVGGKLAVAAGAWPSSERTGVAAARSPATAAARPDVGAARARAAR
jgi:hypothetical protein